MVEQRSVSLLWTRSGAAQSRQGSLKTVFAGNSSQVGKVLVSKSLICLKYLWGLDSLFRWRGRKQRALIVIYRVVLLLLCVWNRGLVVLLPYFWFRKFFKFSKKVVLLPVKILGRFFELIADLRDLLVELVEVFKVECRQFVVVMRLASFIHLYCVAVADETDLLGQCLNLLVDRVLLSYR